MKWLWPRMKLISSGLSILTVVSCMAAHPFLKHTACEVVDVFENHREHLAVSLTQPSNQNRIAGVAHDGLRYAAEHPAFHARAAVGTHRDQVIWGLAT